MLNLFRTNTLSALIAFLVFSILIRLTGFIIDIPLYIQSPTPAAQFVLNWMHQYAPLGWQSALVAALLVILQAFFINFISNSQQVIFKDSVLPGLFFVLLNSIYAPQQLLTPQLIANTFLILLVFRLCFLYESPNPIFPVIDAGILLGLGLLFDPDLILYLPFILLSIIYMTKFNVRYLLVAILSIGVPLYFLAAFLYVNGSISNLLEALYYTIDKSYFKSLGITLEKGYIWFVILPILTFSALQIQTNFFRNKVKTRRLQLMIIIMVPFGFLSLLAGDYGFELALPYLSIPLSFLMANYFVRTSWKWIKEISLFLILAAIVYYQYLMKN